MFSLQRQTSERVSKSDAFNAKVSHPSRTVVHPKLEVTEPGDHDEQEADAVANDVMSGKICRQISHGSVGGGMSVSSQMEGRLNSLQGGGQAMPDGLRSMMERGFSRDFSQVRLHTDSEAASLSSSIHAKAFTHGNDIYFNQGQFSPNTSEGQKLMAHELTHVVQGIGKVGRYNIDSLSWDRYAEAAREGVGSGLLEFVSTHILPIETTAATIMYYMGDGQPMSYGDATKDSIKNSCNMQYYRERLKSGETGNLAEGHGLPIDLTFCICVGEKMKGTFQNPQFYVGHTTMSYKTTCNKEKRECTTTFTVPSKDGDDGFWDVNEPAEKFGNLLSIAEKKGFHFGWFDAYKTDGSNYKLELFGTPYKFKQFSWEETFPLPTNHEIGEDGKPYKINKIKDSTQPVVNPMLYRMPNGDEEDSKKNIDIGGMIAYATKRVRVFFMNAAADIGGMIAGAAKKEIKNNAFQYAYEYDKEKGTGKGPFRSGGSFSLNGDKCNIFVVNMLFDAYAYKEYGVSNINEIKNEIKNEINEKFLSWGLLDKHERKGTYPPNTVSNIYMKSIMAKDSVFVKIENHKDVKAGDIVIWTFKKIKDDNNNDIVQLPHHIEIVSEVKESNGEIILKSSGAHQDGAYEKEREIKIYTKPMEIELQDMYLDKGSKFLLPSKEDKYKRKNTYLEANREYKLNGKPTIYSTYYTDDGPIEFYRFSPK